MPWLLLACLLTTGCVRRRMTIRSNPPGATVYVDDQIEISELNDVNNTAYFLVQVLPPSVEVFVSPHHRSLGLKTL